MVHLHESKEHDYKVFLKLFKLLWPKSNGYGKARRCENAGYALFISNDITIR